jgi:2',3'-cyclic-nucleotide 2'-phosphodiesterase (5'-nucleotidase family)
MQPRTRTKLISLFVLAALLFASIPMAATAQAPVKVDFVLTILHNNDAESALVSLPGQPDFGGAARFKTLVDHYRWNAIHGKPSIPGAKRGVIMVSSGDNFLAGATFSLSLEKGIPFYDTIAMDLIGYDAIAIGNHDFDFTPDVLADFIEGFTYTNPPFLSANLEYSGEPRLQALYDEGRIARSVIIKERGELVGIIGATTPMLRYISSPRNVGIIDDVAAAVNAEVAALEAAGVNKIILISHLQSIDEDLALAQELTGVDIMVAGGGDELLANEGDLLVPGDEGEVFGPYPMWTTDAEGTAIPVVTTSGSYGYLGQLVAAFDKQGNLLMVDEENSGPKRVAGGSYPDAVAPDPMVMALVTEPVIAGLAEMASTVVATSEVALDGRRSMVRTRETNEGNLIADSLLWQANQLAGDFGVPAPDIALQNGGGIRNDSIIPAGPITQLDTHSMVPFPNFVSVVENISREQFKEILENAVSRVEFGDGRFAQIAGFSYTWDATGTAQVLNPDYSVAVPGTRVQEVVLDGGTVIVSGGVVVGGPDLTVATIDFLARGGDQYPFRDAPFTTLGVTYQQALQNYLQIGLSGVVSAADYPEGGEGRITRIN